MSEQNNWKKLAADNYHFLYDFLSGRGLDPDEYHDAVILEYIGAAKNYAGSHDLQGTSFCDYARPIMGKALDSYLRLCRQRDEMFVPLEMIREIPVPGGLEDAFAA